MAFAAVGDSIKEYNSKLYPMTLTDTEANDKDFMNDINDYLSNLDPSKFTGESWATGQCLASRVNSEYYYQCLKEGCYDIDSKFDCSIQRGSEKIDCIKLLTKPSTDVVYTKIYGVQPIKLVSSFIPGLFFSESDFVVSGGSCGYVLDNCDHCETDSVCKDKCEKSIIYYGAWLKARKIMVDELLEAKDPKLARSILYVRSLDSEGKPIETSTDTSLENKLWTFDTETKLEDKKEYSIIELAFKNYQDDYNKDEREKLSMTVYDTLNVDVTKKDLGNSVSVEPCYARYNFNKYVLDLLSSVIDSESRKKLLNVYSKNLALCNYYLVYKKAEEMIQKDYYEYCSEGSACGCTIKKDENLKNNQIIFSGPGNICFEDQEVSIKIKNYEKGYNLRYIGYIDDEYVFYQSKGIVVEDTSPENSKREVNIDRINYNVN